MKKKAKKIKTLSSQLKGRTKRSIKSDKTKSAKSPGKRKAKSGSVYYEDRANRSDIDKKIKL